MAKKKPMPKASGLDRLPENAHIAGAGLVESQKIDRTLEINYMPYAMSVIMSRAIPEIDGFKPSHRKLLYTMYKMNLLNAVRTKSANIVGATMKLNPHGDAAIYETMVRLSAGNQSLLQPYVDSKGNFGRAYSSDMEYAASRYTEAKLSPIAGELFRDIDNDTVDFVDNYDATMKEPTLLPVTFPSVLVNNNMGIAVGMASNICSFNLNEVCETAIALMKDDEADITETLKAPDFPGGGRIIYDRDEMQKIYESGRGSIKVRSVYTYDKSQNCIDITEIPPTTTVEAIIAKMAELVKAGKLREVADVRNEIGLSGLRITIDLKRGVDPDKLMNRLFAMTPLEDSFSCNFNVLIAGVPQVLGVRRILEEWTGFRMECVRRRVYFDLHKAKDKLHLLKGLAKILLDIDKAIRIVRETDEEAEVVPNLMIGFGIDQIQAEYVAEIKLRHLNREYILKRTDEIERLEEEIEEMEGILKSAAKVRSIIVSELKDVMKKHGQPRKSLLLYASDLAQADEVVEEAAPDYPCTLFFTHEGYFKKITPQSLRMSGEQKLKEGDTLFRIVETTNRQDLLFFTNRGDVYKSKASEFGDTKASALGDYIPAKLGMESDEVPVDMIITADYKGYLLFFFENGKVAKVDLASYATKANRRKLVGAYSDKSPLVAIRHITEDTEFLLTSTAGRMLLLHTGAIATKSTRNTQGVQVMTMKKQHTLKAVERFVEGMVAKPSRYRTKSLPAMGATPSAEDVGEQLTLL